MKIAGVTAMAIITRTAQTVRRSITQVTRSGDRIEATRIEGVTTSEAARRQPAALEGAVPGNRLECVLGTGRVKSAARREQRREQALVSANQQGESLARETHDRAHCSPCPQHGGSPGDQLLPESVESGAVGLTACADDEIPGRLMLLKLDPPDFPEAAPETVTGHRGRPKLRNDQSHPRVARRVVHPDHVQVLEAATPSPGQAAANVGRAGEPVGSRQARRRRQEPPCFDGSETVSCFRPFLRRRESVARPQRVAMRARNPCLFTRRLLRGRYDGFMQVFLQSEPGKLLWRSLRVKRNGAAPGTPWPKRRGLEARRFLRAHARISCQEERAIECDFSAVKTH